MIPDHYPNYMYYKAVEICTRYFDSLDIIPFSNTSSIVITRDWVVFWKLSLNISIDNAVILFRTALRFLCFPSLGSLGNGGYWEKWANVKNLIMMNTSTAFFLLQLYEYGWELEKVIVRRVRLFRYTGILFMTEHEKGLRQSRRPVCSPLHENS